MEKIHERVAHLLTNFHTVITNCDTEEELKAVLTNYLNQAYNVGAEYGHIDHWDRIEPTENEMEAFLRAASTGIHCSEELVRELLDKDKKDD